MTTGNKGDEMLVASGTYVIQRIFGREPTTCTIIGQLNDLHLSSVASIKQQLGIPVNLPVTFEKDAGRPICSADFWYMDGEKLPKTSRPEFPPCRVLNILCDEMTDAEAIRAYVWASVFNWDHIDGFLSKARSIYESLDRNDPALQELLSEKTLGYRFER